MDGQKNIQKHIDKKNNGPFHGLVAVPWTFFAGNSVRPANENFVVSDDEDSVFPEDEDRELSEDKC